ncbi:ABC transporter permease [Roseiflexus castenholzii]|uniref:ABC transporter permease n=1 Tax=Roseiflexus castenholzii TaxID=120962 RepID=UPI003C7E8B0F
MPHAGHSEPFASLRVNAARNLSGSRKTPRAARGDHAGWSQVIWYKTRTLLTLPGIAVGVAAVIALSTLGEGIASGFETTSSASGADNNTGGVFRRRHDDSKGNRRESVPAPPDRRLS